MKYTYTINGMHCNSCRTKVENALNTIEGVEAEVLLNPPTAVISMQKPIQTTVFQEALSAVGNYTIKVFNPNDLKLKPVATVAPIPPQMPQGNIIVPCFAKAIKCMMNPELSCLRNGFGFN